MTVTELAERLRRPKGSVAYHVEVLVDAGLLQIVRTQKVRAVDERYYGRAGTHDRAPSTTPGEMPFLGDVIAEVDLDRPEAEAPAGVFTLPPRPDPAPAGRGVRRPARRAGARVHRRAARAATSSTASTSACSRPSHGAPAHERASEHDRDGRPTRRHADATAPTRLGPATTSCSRRASISNLGDGVSARSPTRGWRRRSPAIRCWSPSCSSRNDCRGSCSRCRRVSSPTASTAARRW